MFKTKQIKEHQLQLHETLDMSLQHKVTTKMNKTFYSSNMNQNYNSSASNFMRKSKWYDGDSNTVILSRVKSDLPGIANIFKSSAGKSDKTSLNKGINSSQVIKSGVSFKDIKKIKSLRHNK
jgi:hypothetical protein